MPTTAHEVILDGIPRSLQGRLSKPAGGFRRLVDQGKTIMTSKQELYSRWPSRCCKAPDQLVQSRQGGAVAKVCTNCKKSLQAYFDDLPELPCNKCSKTMPPTYIVNNYGYECTCGNKLLLASILDLWSDLGLPYDGVGLDGR